jgi:uncharacterized membrane protein YfcA
MTSFLALATLSLLAAGFVKGIFGMGLPAVSLGLLSLLMAPVEAATLIVIPTLTTNAWQFFTGDNRSAVVRRFAILLVGVVLGTTIGVGFLTGIRTELVSLALGVVLLSYALVGMFTMRFAIAPAREKLFSPWIGLATGVINGATGVSVMPLVPYLNSIQLQRDALIQVMGLVFMTAMIALAACLAWTGHLRVASGGASALACVPVFLGMYLGQVVRLRLHADAFRRWFFVGLIALGAYSAARALVQLS